jgi:tripartite ATP-independent transporter DctP family solute receptor
MKRVLAVAACLAVVCGAFLLAASEAPPAWAGQKAGTVEKATLKLAHVYAPGHVWDVGSKMAAELVKRNTDGRVQIEVFPASQLGTEEQITEGVIFGSTDIAVSGAGQIGNLFKPIYILEMPYLFTDMDHVMRFAKSPIAKRMFGDLEKEFNIKIVGTSSFGVRHVASVKKPIRTPDDLAGFKLRVPQQQVTMAYGKAMGANPTPIAYAEAYMALQQGLVDGLENPLSAIRSMKFHEVAKHISLTGHVINCTFFIMNGPKFNSLTKKNQDVILDAFDSASQHIITLLKADDKNLIGFFEKEAKVAVNTVDVEAFKKKTASMPVQFRSWWIRYGEDLFQKVQGM